jgi:hypothetical protein
LRSTSTSRGGRSSKALDVCLMAIPAKKHEWITRVLLLVFCGVPGAYLAAGGGIALSAGLFSPDGPSDLWLSLLLFPASLLLLLGTGTIREPLFLLVFLPMPVLMAAGFYLREYHNPALWQVQMLGMAMPVIAYFPVSRHYKKRQATNEKCV